MRSRLARLGNSFTQTPVTTRVPIPPMTTAGTVPAVVMGGVGTLLVTGTWINLFPTLANRDRMHEPVDAAKA